MSSFIVSPGTMSDAVQVCVDFLCSGGRLTSSSHLRSSGPFRAIDVPDRARELTPIPTETEEAYRERVWNALYDLNERAVAGRYKEAQRPGCERPKPDTSPSLVDRAQLYKSARCLVYQCHEDATHDDPAQESLKYALDLAAHAIASSVAEGAVWGRD